MAKGQHLTALEVYKNQSPKTFPFPGRLFVFRLSVQVCVRACAFLPRRGHFMAPLGIDPRPQTPNILHI